MTYFTSWEINLFLCLVSVGLPEDLVKEWVGRIKIEDRKFCLEIDRCYHLDRFSALLQFRRNWGAWSRSAYGRILMDFKSKVEDIEPEDRYGYFEWAYENHYYTWSLKDLEWVKGFHPGRFYLMDYRRKETMEEIRDLEDIGAWQEERFIRTQDHIDDLLEGRKKELGNDSFTIIKFDRFFYEFSKQTKENELHRRGLSFSMSSGCQTTRDTRRE